ncbi:hypothetical protein [Tenacibaculum xiamenense]|uniref:hypothetical protein n=1 Tax=Tenacibaculum xiamenense TaxID=1261553 RepID=UPI0038953732
MTTTKRTHQIFNTHMKPLLYLVFIISFISCDKYSREKYPQKVSKRESYKHINSCYSEEFNNLSEIPDNIQHKINKFLIKRLEVDNFKKLNFKTGFILSNAPIKIITNEKKESITDLLGQDMNKEDCDTILNFPIYSVYYELEKLKLGIEKMGFNLMVDKNGKCIKDIDFPKVNFANNIIPIDSVHSELIRRKISPKKLHIDFWFDNRKDTFFWATSTVISEGSILGSSCFPNVQYHFKMNAKSGEITEYNFEKREDYFSRRDNRYFE